MTSLFASAAGGVDLPLWSGIAAALFYAGLAYFGWPTVKAALKTRQRTAISGLAKAQLAERELAALKAKHEGARENLLRETGAMLAEGRRDADVLRENLVNNARDEIARLKIRGERESQQASYAAQSAIYQAGAEDAVALAGKTLAVGTTADDQRKLVDEALKQLEQRLKGAK